MSGDNLRARLRAALALVGQDPGEGASLRDLVARAAEVIRAHARDCPAPPRGAPVALPSGDDRGPWRVGATVQVYDVRRDEWTRAVITARTPTAAGATLTLRAGLRTLRHVRLPRTARYATGQASGQPAWYAVPDGTPQADARTWFTPPTFRGEYRTFKFSLFLPGGVQTSGAVRARSLPEAAALSTAAGFTVTVHHLREYANEAGGAAHDAATAHPDTLMVERPRGQWVPYHVAVADAATQETP